MPSWSWFFESSGRLGTACFKSEVANDPKKPDKKPNHAESTAFRAGLSTGFAADPNDESTHRPKHDQYKENDQRKYI